MNRYRIHGFGGSSETIFLNEFFVNSSQFLNNIPRHIPYVLLCPHLLFPTFHRPQGSSNFPSYSTPRRGRAILPSVVISTRSKDSEKSLPRVVSTLNLPALPPVPLFILPQLSLCCFLLCDTIKHRPLQLKSSRKKTIWKPQRW